MKKNIKNVILFLSTSLAIILIISFLYNKVNAAFVDKNDVANGNYDFIISYQNDMSSDLIHKTIHIRGDEYRVFCREKGGTLYGSGHGVAKYYYRKTFTSLRQYTTKSASEDTRKLAYLLYKHQNSTYEQQRIIWASDRNAGTEVEYYLWNHTTVSEYKEPKIEIITRNAKTSNDGNNYKIGPIKVKFSGGNEAGKAVLNDTIDIINADSNNVKTSIKVSGISNNEEFYIKIPKSDLDGVKKIKLKMYVETTYDTVDYYYFQGTGYGPDGVIKDSAGQKLVAVNPGKDKDSANDTSESIKLTQPRLVTTKYIKKITSANGKELYNIPDSWNSNDWDAENLKPIVKVNTNKGVTESGRYELTKQNARNFNITAGDVITYNIRVYNVGNDDADLTDESLESVNKDGDGIIYKNGYVYDNPDDHLEFVDKDINDNKYWEWDSSEGAYRAKATNLKVKKSRPSDTIESYEKASDNINRWSGVMQIDFKVTGDEQASFKIKNNGLTAQREDATVKFLKSVTTKDKDGNDVETVFDKEPEVEVDTSKKVGEDNRIIINTNTPDVTVMDGDTLTYCMRYYSTALNKTELNYKAIDKFRRRVRI